MVTCRGVRLDVHRAVLPQNAVFDAAFGGDLQEARDALFGAMAYKYCADFRKCNVRHVFILNLTSRAVHLVLANLEAVRSSAAASLPNPPGTSDQPPG